MGDPRGFLSVPRKKGGSQAVDERLCHFREFEVGLPTAELRAQASRCMDCGIPFCHSACPLGNLVPEWNDRVYRGDWQGAAAALLATNNFPEVTGRVCPAPCEAACVLNIEKQPVTIKDVERAIALENSDLFAPQPPVQRLAGRVAVVGSGPAGLAAAQQLARQGYAVTVFERADRLGGLLRYGIPDFKLDKTLIDKRIAQMRAEGVHFVTGAQVGVSPKANELRRDFEAIVLATGARKARELEVPGRELAGIHLAMEYLTQQNRRNAGDPESAKPISARGKRVVILGGGDTGSDCLGTALRQGAVSVRQLELLPCPPVSAAADNPWPEWPRIFRTSSSQEEGGERDFAVLTKELLADEQGRVRGLRAVRVHTGDGKIEEVPGSAFEIPCDLVLLAMGFVGPAPSDLADLGVGLDERGNVAVTAGATNVAGVFAAGDVARGASLVVWAIAEGRRAATSVHAYLAARAADVA